MITLLAVVVTAITVAAITAFATRRVTERSIVKAIDGRPGADPVRAHRRQLDAAEGQVTQAQERADQLALSLEALTSGVIIADDSGNVIARNRLAREATARSHEQTLVDATVTELIDAATSGTAGDREVEIFGPPGRTLSIHAAPIIRAGQVLGALAVIDDVTDQHRVEKIRRDFVANLSHELRTPIGALSLLAEMVQDETDADTRARLNSRILAETARLEQTIQDLLELSRIESDTDRFDETIVVQDLVADAIARVRVRADAANVAVGAIVPPEPLTMLGNLDQLTSCLVNLLENAVKYSDAHDTVSVRARVDGADMHLAVQDTGRGIPARDLDRIFERFYRVDRSRDATTGGTGIGLSIVRHVALNHGGSVTVDSFEGEGTTFTVILPLVTAQPAPARPASEIT